MLVERRAKAQERRLVPETSARFLAESANFANRTLKPIAKEPYSVEPGSTLLVLKNYERSPRWSHGALINRYPRRSTDRETADRTRFEWITPGHALFEVLRRYAWDETGEACANGAGFHSLEDDTPSRIPKQCKRLAEADFPIAVVSKHSAEEKSIRHGQAAAIRRELRQVFMDLALTDRFRIE